MSDFYVRILPDSTPITTSMEEHRSPVRSRSRSQTDAETRAADAETRAADADNSCS